MIQLNAIVSTSYDTGPYIITEISKPCTCAHTLEVINYRKEAIRLPEHYHIKCKGLEDGKEYGLSYCTLEGKRVTNKKNVRPSVWGHDHHLILQGNHEEEEIGQLKLF